MTDEFARFHPIVNLIFYIAVLVISMIQMQVGLMVISFVGSLAYHLYLKKARGLKYLLIVGIIFITSAIINPLFSHRGATVLFYLFSGNPVTLESVFYGLAAAFIIATMMLWFSSFNEIMTGDRLLAGIGVWMPHVAMLLSMIFRFVPRFIKQGRAVLDANRALGMQTKGLKNKVKAQADVFSITTTWALESSVDTADSMRARGYGTARRSRYDNYRFEVRDLLVSAWLIIAFIFLCVALTRKEIFTYYYPVIRVQGNMLAYIICVLLCFTPILINIVEEIRWHRLRSKI